jgi:hypothetical protein
MQGDRLPSEEVRDKSEGWASGEGHNIVPRASLDTVTAQKGLGYFEG